MSAVSSPSWKVRWPIVGLGAAVEGSQCSQQRRAVCSLLSAGPKEMLTPVYTRSFMAPPQWRPWSRRSCTRSSTSLAWELGKNARSQACPHLLNQTLRVGPSPGLRQSPVSLMPAQEWQPRKWRGPQGRERETRRERPGKGQPNCPEEAMSCELNQKGSPRAFSAVPGLLSQHTVVLAVTVLCAFLVLLGKAQGFMSD